LEHLREAREYTELLTTKGWKRFSEKYRKAAEETGKLAVFPMLNKDIQDDRLIRANQTLKMIFEVENIALRLEEYEDKLRSIKNLK